jgi:hypothetical protein
MSSRNRRRRILRASLTDTALSFPLYRKFAMSSAKENSSPLKVADTAVKIGDKCTFPEKNGHFHKK